MNTHDLPLSLFYVKRLQTITSKDLQIILDEIIRKDFKYFHTHLGIVLSSHQVFKIVNLYEYFAYRLHKQ